MTSSSAKKLQKELKQKVLQELCFSLDVEAKKNNNKIPYGMVNKIVRESEKQFPFVTRSVINKSYKNYISGNFPRLAHIKSHPIMNDEKEKPASAGKELSSSKSSSREKVAVDPSFIIPKSLISRGVPPTGLPPKSADGMDVWLCHPCSTHRIFVTRSVIYCHHQWLATYRCGPGAQRNGAVVHLGRRVGLVVGKGSELPDGDLRKTFK